MFIRLNSIEIFAHHGVYEEEAREGNHFEIDLEVIVPDIAPATADLLNNVMDYTALYKTVIAVSESKRYNLLESFARDICSKVLDAFTTVESVRIKLRKLNPPIAGSVKNVEVEMQIKR